MQRRLCVVNRVVCGRQREKFLGTNFMSLKTEGEDKALTLPNKSSHFFNTRTVTKSPLIPNDPPVNHQQATCTFQSDLQLKKSKYCRTNGGN